MAFEAEHEGKILKKKYLDQKLNFLRKHEIRIEKLIYFSFKYGHPKLAKKYLKEVEKLAKESSKHYLLLEILVNGDKDATLRKKINNALIEEKERTELYYEAANNSIAENKLDEAKKYIEEALKIEPENSKCLDTSKDIVVLTESLANVEQIPTDTKKENTDIEKDNIDILDKADSTYDWQAYAKRIQNECILRKVQKLTQLVPEQLVSHRGWNIKSKYISLEEVRNTEIHYKGVKYYSSVSPKVNKKYTEAMPEIDRSLAKELVTQKMGKNGVKFDRGVPKVKVNNEFRICGKIYKNIDGDALIYFHKGFPSHEASDNYIRCVGDIYYNDES